MPTEIDELFARIIEKMEADPEYAKTIPAEEVDVIIAKYRADREGYAVGIKPKKIGQKPVDMSSVLKALTPFAEPKAEDKSIRRV